jgi:hypothetical protein
MEDPSLRVRRALVVGPAPPAGPAHQAARLLAGRLGRRTGCAVEVQVVTSSDTDADSDAGPDAALPLPAGSGQGWDIVFLVADASRAAERGAYGDPDASTRAIAALRRRGGGALPEPAALRPEGFALRTLRPAGAVPVVVVLGADGPGALFGVGRLLREIVPGDGWCDVPALHLDDAPAFPVRGTALSQTSGAVAAALDLPRWTAAQWEEHVAELSLWGYNLLRGGGRPDQMEAARRYGMRVSMSLAPNRIDESAVTEEMRGTHFQRALVCPSNPAARARILAEREATFRACPHLDVLYQPSGDHAGCHCPRCRPWVRTYLALAEEIAQLLRRYHPRAEVWLSNQQLSIDENRLLLEYLQEVRPTWAQALHYGPSGDEASPYLRPGEVNWRWHTYPGFGTANRFLAHLRAALPPEYALVLYPDLTHYIQSQFGLETADPAVVRFHGRDAYFVRAEGYRRVFERVAPLLSGSSGYTEGIYDDVQKVLWAQWLWNPDLSTADALDAYCRWSFGPAAAPRMASVLQALERHWDGPLPSQPALDATAQHVDTATERVPERLRAGNWRLTYATWRTRADLLVRHKLDTAQALEHRLRERLQPLLSFESAGHAPAVDPGALAAALRDALRLLDDGRAAAERAAGPLKDALRHLDDRLRAQAGVRAPGTAHADLDLGHAAWDRARLESALAAARDGATARALALVREVVAYEDPGPGGCYDDLGHPARQPHLRFGHPVARYCNVAVPPELAEQRPLPWDIPIYDPANRPSQNSFAFTYNAEPGVRLAYTGLDPQAAYRVRLTYCVPRTWPRRFAMRQRLEANGLLVHDEREVPEYTAEHVELALPREATAAGALDLQFHAADGSMGTAVSEVWLLRAA